MNEAASHSESSKRPALPWLLLAGFGLVLAMALNWFLEWSLQFTPANAALPEGLVLDNLRRLTYGSPIGLGIMAMLARRWPKLVEKWPLLISVIGVATVHLVCCYWVMVIEVAFRTGLTPHRFLPEVRAVIEGGDSLDVLSIWPAQGTKPNVPFQTFGEFHGYPVLGRVTLTNAVARQEVISGFLASVDESFGGKSLCFVPRHALQIRRGLETVELVICYECGYAETYCEGDRSEIGLTRSSKVLLNRLLTESGVPLAPEKIGAIAPEPASAK